MTLQARIYRCKEDGQTVDRLMIVFYKVPIYFSSGKNSHCKGTAFPFFGVEPQSVNKILIKGALRKPTFPHGFTAVVYRMMKENKDANKLPLRFGSPPCLLLSSLLGGGI